MLARMPQLADAWPSRAALNGLPSASRNDPLRSRPASPIGTGRSLGGGWPGTRRGATTARSLRGSAAMISASNPWRPSAQTTRRFAPLTTWNAVRISPDSPMTTPEP